MGASVSGVYKPEVDTLSDSSGPDHWSPTRDALSGVVKVVFNIVWTGDVFTLLRPLTASILKHSDARLRFIANACPASEISEMERFASQHPGRVVDVVEASRDRMIRHGQALDHVLARIDGEELFGLLDPDIFAVGSFLPQFEKVLADVAAVTSGKEVWSDDNTRPAENPGVAGEYFFDIDGFVFGSPHFSIYRVEQLRTTIDRWGIGFGSAGNDLTDATKKRLAEMNRAFWLYDTGKLVNILLQADGNKLVHMEHENLVHVGGVSHFLAPPATAPAARDKPPRWGEGDGWQEDPRLVGRATVARYTARVLTALRSGQSPPPVPEAGHLGPRLEKVRSGLISLDHL